MHFYQSIGAYMKYQTLVKQMARDLTTRDTPSLNMKILFGPCFSIHEPMVLHDQLMALTLQTRGAEVISIYCDSIQTVECNQYGGISNGRHNFAAKCRSCNQVSRQVWDEINIKATPFSKYLEAADHIEIAKILNSIPTDKWADFVSDSIPFGRLAKDILVNNYLVGNYYLIDNHEKLGRAHLTNLLLLNCIYPRILDTVKPDRIVCNDTYYGMYFLMQEHAIRKKIPIYSNWIGGKRDSWCYALNDASMNLDFSKAWPAFSSIPLTKEQVKKVENWLDTRINPVYTVFPLSKVTQAIRDDLDFSKLDPDKPIALLAANVIWDLAALNKQVVFSDMAAWIRETIDWFRDKPDYQLVIKPHPVEEDAAIQETEEKISSMLESEGLKLPGNVFLLPPKTKTNVYQLMSLVKVLLVHTTTVGIEFAAKGIPVITTATSPYSNFGFTLDPKTKPEYFLQIKNILSGRVRPELLPSKKTIDLAYKFILFYFYHYYTKIDLLDYRVGKAITMNIVGIDDLLPGKHKQRDFIIDSIIEGLPIISLDRWPPESADDSFAADYSVSQKFRTFLTFCRNSLVSLSAYLRKKS